MGKNEKGNFSITTGFQFLQSYGGLIVNERREQEAKLGKATGRVLGFAKRPEIITNGKET
tara:strand:- start:8829 stop:9008 length:180 start_codon:yes stop_codon:yes gene_type:complete